MFKPLLAAAALLGGVAALPAHAADAAYPSKVIRLVVPDRKSVV